MRYKNIKVEDKKGSVCVIQPASHGVLMFPYIKEKDNHNLDKIYKMYFTKIGTAYWKGVKRIHNNGICLTSSGMFFNGEPIDFEDIDLEKEKNRTLKIRERNKNIKKLLS